MRGKNLYFAPAYTLAVVLRPGGRVITRRLDFRIKRKLRPGRGVAWRGAVWRGVEEKPGGLVLSPKKAGTSQKVPARCMYELIAKLQPGILRYAVFVYLFLVVIRVNAFRQTPRDERPFLVEAVLGVVGVFALILAY